MSSSLGERPASRWLILVGFPIGFVSSLCGIGGGLFAGAFLHFVMGMGLRRSAGTGLVLVMATTLASTVTEATKADPAIQWSIAGIMVVGVLVGASLGQWISERISERLLRGVFAVVLLFSASRLLLDAGHSEVLGGAPFEPHAFQYLTALCIGLGGGILAPILGVGGGLVMVPGLFLGLSGFGFGAARATSLAVGAVGSSRAMMLKGRAGQVAWKHGGQLALGSLIGAAAGVSALGVHAELLQYGRRGIGILLGLVALRFVRELLQKHPAPAPN